MLFIKIQTRNVNTTALSRPYNLICCEFMRHELVEIILEYTIIICSAVFIIYKFTITRNVLDSRDLEQNKNRVYKVYVFKPYLCFDIVDMILYCLYDCLFFKANS